jgi:hypothetical protein
MATNKHNDWDSYIGSHFRKPTPPTNLSPAELRAGYCYRVVARAEHHTIWAFIDLWYAGQQGGKYVFSSMVYGEKATSPCYLNDLARSRYAYTEAQVRELEYHASHHAKRKEPEADLIRTVCEVLEVPDGE